MFYAQSLFWTSERLLRLAPPRGFVKVKGAETEPVLGRTIFWHKSGLNSGLEFTIIEGDSKGFLVSTDAIIKFPCEGVIS